MLLIKKNALNEKIILAIILLIAYVLRIYKLDSNSIWLDEGGSIWIASQNNISEFFLGLIHNWQQPLYHIILHFWICIFGKSEYSVRFPSVIFDLLTILMTYKIGKLLFDKNLGILCSLLMGISTFHLGYSQQARPYTLLTFLASLSIYFFIALLKKVDFKNLIIYAISSTLLIYCHTFGLFIILAQNIYIFTKIIFRKNNQIPTLKSWISSQLTILVLFLPWLTTVINQLHNRSALALSEKISFSTLIHTFTVYYCSSKFLLIIFILLIITNMIFSKDKDKLYLLFLLFLFPIIVLYTIAKMKLQIYMHAYTLTCTVPFYLLVAGGLTKLHKYIRLILLIVVILFSLIDIRSYYAGTPSFGHLPSQWKEVVNFIDKNATNKDLLIFDPWYNENFLYNYYSKRNDLIKRGYSNLYSEPGFININNSDSYFKNYKKIWFIYSDISEGEKSLEVIVQKTHKLIIDRNKYIYPEIKIYESR